MRLVHVPVHDTLKVRRPESAELLFVQFLKDFESVVIGSDSGLCDVPVVFLFPRLEHRRECHIVLLRQVHRRDTVQGLQRGRLGVVVAQRHTVFRRDPRATPTPL